MAKRDVWRKRQNRALQREIMREEQGFAPVDAGSGRSRRGGRARGGVSVGSVVLLILIVVLFAIALFLIWLIATAQLTISSNGIVWEQDGQIVWTSIKDARLPKTADAGESYVNSTIFLGDSNTLRLSQYGLAPYVGARESIGISAVRNEAFIGVEGQEGEFTIPQLVGNVKPKRVVMSFGINDISGQNAPEAFIAEYKAAIEAIRSASPDTRIIVAAIPAIAEQTAYEALSLKAVQGYNTALLEMCNEAGVSFLDVNETLADGNGYLKEGYADADGLHLTQAALEAYMEYFRTHALKA